MSLCFSSMKLNLQDGLLGFQLWIQVSEQFNDDNRESVEGTEKKDGADKFFRFVSGESGHAAASTSRS